MTNIFNTIKEGFIEIFNNPLSIAALLGLMIVILALISFKKIKLDSKTMARIGLALALATILDFVKIIDLPNGIGSINLGSVVPIIVIALFYGAEIGMLTGLLFGLINLIISPYIVHPLQVLFDYPLPYMAVGLAGYFKNRKLIGASVGMFFKFIFHFISGFLFFGQFAPDGWSPALYSFVANASYVGSNLIIVIVLLLILPIETVFKKVFAVSQ
ncbi:energy-coupled thiamine transporter ThiT [Clostridium sartagoforme]|uniref:Energy-coupled thiamine transporter ThiT n=1 Tax=Clostridium sartagoforme TaxID=84031 RepID=A0A4S2DSG1_9CLOT|nr:energy-coupled thiamine transporter ThiT [Clostridium sartagoforme]TGY44011.1 energy-coupled thiamine transporter ThiT [Clostridium sartagoforme]